MNILLLTQYFPPEFGAASVRLGRLAQLLAEVGHQVTVLTSVPNYPMGIVPSEYKGRFAQHEVLGNIEVERVWVYASPSKRVGPRMMNQISFMASAALRGTFLRRPDVILVESHPLFACLAGGWLRRIKRAPVVLNVSDLWPESAVAIGALRAESLLVRAAAGVERWAYRDATHIVGMTEGVCRGVRSLLNQDGGHVTLIQNAVDLTLFRPGLSEAGTLLRRQFGLEGKLTVGHIGNMSLAHDFDILLDAADALPDLAFVFAGGGSQADYIKEQVSARSLQNVVLTGILPHTDMPALWAATDICLIAFKDHPLFEGALPSKMFEALATGTPVVAAARGEAERLLHETGAGIAVGPGNRVGLVDALRALAASSAQRLQMGTAGRAYAERHLAPTRVRDSFLSIFYSIKGVALPEDQFQSPPPNQEEKL